MESRIYACLLICCFHFRPTFLPPTVTDNPSYDSETPPITPLGRASASLPSSPISIPTIPVQFAMDSSSASSAPEREVTPATLTYYTPQGIWRYHSVPPTHVIPYGPS